MAVFALRHINSVLLTLALLTAWKRGVGAPVTLFLLALSLGGILTIVGRR